jgi:hypothetical protein
MINLIPEKAKREVVKEYWVRVVTMWLFTLSVSSLVVALLLLPVYVLVTSQVEAYASDATEATKKVAEYDLSATSLVMASKQAQMIVALRQSESFSEMIELLESLKGEGIVLESFNLTRDDGAKMGNIKIEGQALTRQDLVDFRDLLLSHSKIKEVNLPISNLAKDKNIPFNIAIILNGTEN